LHEGQPKSPHPKFSDFVLRASFIQNISKKNKKTRGYEMNKTKMYISALVFSMLAAGCNRETDNTLLYRNYAGAQGRDVQIKYMSPDKKIIQMRIGKYESDGSFSVGLMDSPLIVAMDRYNGDKIFDEVKLYGTPGDSIINLASIPVLDDILRKLTGPDAPKTDKK
jgi:hypothetical protein